MERLGQTYLETTLRKKMREIAIYEPECEVDPSKLAAGSKLDKNWRLLIDVTKEVWQLIHQSAERCPMELRIIFRRIQDYVCQRYGKSAPMAKYTSVSGFLFLRFFVAATFNPHLFGLIEGRILPYRNKLLLIFSSDDTAHTAPEAHRCFMLIAKSLQGLANLTTFGRKESWMAPMDQFVSGHSEEFKEFIDTICDVDNFSPSPLLETHLIADSSTRSQYMQLSHAARDGIPSLPHLIDRSREIATLVRTWLGHGRHGEQRLSFASTRNADSAASISSDNGDIPAFDAACLEVQQKTQKLLDQADREDANDESAVLLTKWASIAEKMETGPSEFWVTDSPKTQRATGGGKLPFFKRSEKERNVTRPGSQAALHGSSDSSDANDKKSRKKSPPRSAPDNAMRKLGWM